MSPAFSRVEITFLSSPTFCKPAETFIDKFNEVKEATRSAISKVTANGGAAVTPVTSANASPITARAATAAPDQPSDNLLEPPGAAVAPTPSIKSEDEIPHPRSHSVSGIVQGSESPSHQVKLEKTPYIGPNPNPIDMQLKYENDRLKLALAQRMSKQHYLLIQLQTKLHVHLLIFRKSLIFKIK
ncbi:hypothetical protein NQ318_015442 [Aromia moschata]|uniref:Uncharacterized protein n=1 Tax=Aromia moschata TaxID=1265417 RepID=A0AAV8XC42_9CUCU|nr:hypothetical protein NQ318_015442 [Aromia moschata]